MMVGKPPAWQPQLIDAIRVSPGASTRQLARAVGISEWTADYHLRRLLRNGAVTTESMGRSRVWYAAGCGLCPVLRRAVPPLRRPEAQAVAMAADEWPVALPVLAKRARVPIGTARWVANVLTDAFILERSRFGRVTLRRGAATCVAAAAEGRRCDLWGKCAVSRAWSPSGPDEMRSRP